VSHRVYFYDDASGVQRAADGAKPESLEEILALMDRVLQEPGSFVGVLAPDDSLLTFLVTGEGSVQMDVPQPGRRGSYMKVSNLDACKDVMKRFAEAAAFVHSDFDGLAFEKW